MRIDIMTDAIDKKNSYALACARAQYGTINGRIETWKALKEKFRYDRNNHH